MVLEAIIPAILSSGGTAIIMFLLTWKREARKDQATVAAEWEKGQVALMQSNREEITRLGDVVEGLNGRVETLNANLDVCETKLRRVSYILDDAIYEMERHDIDTTRYRERMRAV